MSEKNLLKAIKDKELELRATTCIRCRARLRLEIAELKAELNELYNKPGNES